MSLNSVETLLNITEQSLMVATVLVTVLLDVS